SGASGTSGPTGTSDSAQNHPPPPPSSITNQCDQSHSSAAPGSSKTAASTAYTTWTTTTSRLEPAASSVPKDVLIHEESDFKAQDMGSDDEDIGSSLQLRISTGELSAFIDQRYWSMEESHKLLTNQVDEGLLRYNVSRPLPLAGPPGQVTIQTEFFFNKDLEYP
ncbi:hypothetical protein Tco_0188176, partial [Tanacetum coccineum]